MKENIRIMPLLKKFNNISEKGNLTTPQKSRQEVRASCGARLRRARCARCHAPRAGEKPDGDRQ